MSYLRCGNKAIIGLGLFGIQYRQSKGQTQSCYAYGNAQSIGYPDVLFFPRFGQFIPLLVLSSRSVLNSSFLTKLFDTGLDAKTAHGPAPTRELMTAVRTALFGMHNGSAAGFFF